MLDRGALPSLSESSPTHSRDHALDLIKWLALLTMLIDHLRLVWPQLADLFVIGRWAFPLFCLAIAANVFRAAGRPLWQLANARYLGYLLLFALISEYPYHLLSTDSITFNIMPTLAIGLLLCWCVQYPSVSRLVISAALLGLSYQMNAQLMYGWLGVLLPAACLLAIRYGYWVWGLPALIAVLVNFPYELRMGAALQATDVLILGSAAFAPLFGLWLLQQRYMPFNVQPVGRWGYWFYPVHLLGLALLRELIF